MKKSMIIKLCSIRDIYKAICEFEQQFFEEYQLAFNEAMAMCALSEGKLSPAELEKNLGSSTSDVLKITAAIESYGFSKKIRDENDSSQMYFTLTESGKEKIAIIKTGYLPLSDLLERLILVADIFEKP